MAATTCQWMPDCLAVDLIQVEYADNGQEEDTYLRPIANTGEMYYYTLVSISNMHYFSDRQKQQAWVAKLPGRTMKPDDWTLEPAVEEKGPDGKLIGKPVVAISDVG